MKLVLIIQAAATLMMTGVIWFVQIVHYPLFNRVGQSEFTAYESAHSNLTTFVVAPLMFVELVTASLLFIQKPEGVSSAMLTLGLALVLAIWFSTFFIQVPQHKILAHGFDERAYRTLVVSNWIRVFAWSARSMIVLNLLSRMMK